MNIYIDFDDCLCETARRLTTLVDELFGIKVPYENIRNFDLKTSFNLTEEQYEHMMIEGHKPRVLLSYKETEGAVKTVNEWVDAGHNVSIITGRPFSAYEPSREWLDIHGLDRVKLYCFNKYGRDSFIKNSDFSLELEDYYKMHFDYAIEDSPLAFKFFSHMPDLKVMVIDRPWNKECTFPSDAYTRCYDWETIKERAKLL